RPELMARWEKAALEAISFESNWLTLVPETVKSQRGTKLSADKDGVVTAEGEPKDGKDTYRLTFRTALRGVTGFRLEALGSDNLPDGGPGRGADGSFVLTEIRLEEGTSNQVKFARAQASFAAPEFPAETAVDG